jgi:hypothetical protein
MSALQKAFLGIFLTASTTALADPATLVCDGKGPAGVYSFDGSIIVDLDETARTVTVHYPGVTNFNSGGHMEAHSIGPVPGTFDANAISFSIPGENIAINRVTGEAVVRTEGGITMAESWNCRVGKKQF